MAKIPSAPRSKQPPSEPTVAIPAENANLLQEVLGVEIGGSRDVLVARLTASVSRSSSPYTSAEMLDEYVQRGMPEVKERALDTIDAERLWRHEREEAEQAHQHWLDRDERKQQHRSQRSSFWIAILGTASSLAAGYLGVPVSICVAVACLSIGGPSTATIIARFLPTKAAEGKS